MTLRKTMTQLAALALVCATMASVASAAPEKKPVAAEKPAVKEKPAAERTLDAIRIEGQIDVPQVLFIQARDRRRFRDGLGRNYLAGAADVARTQLPTSLCVVPRQVLKEEGP